MTESLERFQNKLINSKSPYLLQHAYNPVNWYEWGPEALEKAKKENKPIFLSIGYSTCHWCHVMEKESFEDEEVAALLNERFISIKVDREERPDLDSIYMSVCQLMTGQGGWPLNVFLTPEQVPFYAGTYFPKESRYGRPGMKDVVVQLYDVFQNDKLKITAVGNQIRAAIAPRVSIDNKIVLTPEDIEACFYQLNTTFDPTYGGFGDAPKFPLPHHLMFLLRYYRHTNNERALYMVEKTLDGLANGGIYDHIGFGFSRYSTDEEYLVPHFEKMLYDNAMLAIVYTEAFQVTKNQKYKKIVEEIFTYVLRDMKDDNGAFYSAEDADSEGVEGKFYVWKPEEVKQVLGEEIGELYCSVYDITKDGNFEGESIPNLIHQNAVSYAKEHQIEVEIVFSTIETARIQLFNHREKRIHPHKDDKILTAWNALMIAAFAKASRVFGDESYLEAARVAMTFLEEKLVINDRIMVRYRDGEVKQKGFIDEYAYLSWAYLELYEATLEISYLEKTQRTVKHMIALFWDQDTGGFYFYGEDNEQLLIRPKESYDGALPSGNSVASLQMLRLARLTGDTTLEEKVNILFTAFAEQVKKYPSGHTFMMQSYLTSQMDMKEVVVLSEQVTSFVKLLQQDFYPEVTYLIGRDSSELEHIAPFTNGYKQINNEATYYICENFVCHKPINDEKQAIQYLKG